MKYKSVFIFALLVAFVQVTNAENSEHQSNDNIKDDYRTTTINYKTKHATPQNIENRRNDDLSANKVQEDQQTSDIHEIFRQRLRSKLIEKEKEQKRDSAVQKSQEIETLDCQPQTLKKTDNYRSADDDIKNYPAQLQTLKQPVNKETKPNHINKQQNELIREENNTQSETKKESQMFTKQQHEQNMENVEIKETGNLIEETSINESSKDSNQSIASIHNDKIEFFYKTDNKELEALNKTNYSAADNLQEESEKTEYAEQFENDDIKTDDILNNTSNVEHQSGIASSITSQNLPISNQHSDCVHDIFRNVLHSKMIAKEHETELISQSNEMDDNNISKQVNAQETAYIKKTIQENHRADDKELKISGSTFEEVNNKQSKSQEIDTSTSIHETFRQRLYSEIAEKEIQEGDSSQTTTKKPSELDGQQQLDKSKNKEVSKVQQSSLSKESIRALATDFHMKALIVPSKNGTCFCTCDINTQPHFISVDPSSIPEYYY